MTEKIIQLSDPMELSTNFVSVEGAVSRDFDGYLTCTILYNGLPVAIMTHKDSNYCDAGHDLPGWQPIILDDHGQVQCYASFLHWIGEAGEDFPALVAEVLGRAPMTRKTPRGAASIKFWNFYDAMDEADHRSATAEDDDPRGWMGDGHDWCGFGDTVDIAMYKAFPDEWPRPRNYYGPDLGSAS